MPKSLTVSQLLGRGQLALWETRSHRPRSPPHWEQDRQEGPEGPGLPGEEHSAFPGGPGGIGQRRGLCLAGQGQVQGRGGKGALARTVFLARRASTSKSRLIKGGRAVLKPGRPPPPQSLQLCPQAPQPQCRAPARVCWRDFTSTMTQGGEMPPHSVDTGVRGAGGRARLAQHPLPASPPGPPSRACASAPSVPRRGVRKETRLNVKVRSTSEKLRSGRRRTKSREASPSPETGGTGGLEAEGPARRGF